MFDENNGFYYDSTGKKDLTNNERLLMELLFENPERIATIDDISIKIYNSKNKKQQLTDRIRKIVCRLNKKITDFKIIAVVKYGYKII